MSMAKLKKLQALEFVFVGKSACKLNLVQFFGCHFSGNWQGQ
jgi:hypothetical protein